MNELVGIIDTNESLIDSYIIMDNYTIYKSHAMIGNTESEGYRVMYLSPPPIYQI